MKTSAILSQLKIKFKSRLFDPNIPKKIDTCNDLRSSIAMIDILVEVIDEPKQDTPAIEMSYLSGNRLGIFRLVYESAINNQLISTEDQLNVNCKILIQLAEQELREQKSYQQKLTIQENREKKTINKPASPDQKHQAALFKPSAPVNKKNMNSVSEAPKKFTLS